MPENLILSSINGDNNCTKIILKVGLMYKFWSVGWHAGLL